jgi:hypothetical protein
LLSAKILHKSTFAAVKVRMGRAIFATVTTHACRINLIELPSRLRDFTVKWNRPEGMRNRLVLTVDLILQVDLPLSIRALTVPSTSRFRFPGLRTRVCIVFAFRLANRPRSAVRARFQRERDQRTEPGVAIVCNNRSASRRPGDE